MSRREVGFLVIGISFGLQFYELAVLGVIAWLRETGTSVSTFELNKFIRHMPLVLPGPILLLVVGLVLLEYRKRSELNAN